MEPLISMTILNPKRSYHGGDLLEGEVQVDAVPLGAIHCIETTVLWTTEGKGDEDFGVHFFERRLQEELVEGDLRELHRFSTRLPLSPLSYDGHLLKIRWCVRTRVFLKEGKEVLFEEAFQLGGVAPVGNDDEEPVEANTALTDTVRNEAEVDTHISHPPEPSIANETPAVGSEG